MKPPSPLLLPLLPLLLSPGAKAFVSQTTCNAETYTYNQLAGYGYVPSDAYDKYHDTLGGMGSAIAIPRDSWRKLKGGGYTGKLWASPDRGWNTQGTTNYQPRLHRFTITLTPAPGATTTSPTSPNINLRYDTTILLTDPSGNPLTGLDADGSGFASFKGKGGIPFPDLPVATYTGDGFGGTQGTGGRRVAADNEGLVVAGDGTFWVSDEYGPYVYQYGAGGKMKLAVRPPDAFIPMRNGSESFSSDAPFYNSNATDDVNPALPTSGRTNNHGLEGLTLSPSGNTLFTLLQSATTQDGGTSSSTSRYTRLLAYDISDPQKPPQYKAQYVVPLPTYYTGKKNKTAAQSEVLALSETRFLVLARDSGAGRGQDSSESLYRHADVFDVSNATDVKGGVYDCADCAVAPDGVLADDITPATYCSFLDYNVNSELERFGVHNGGSQDNGLLNEKWESLAVVPVNPGVEDGCFFLFSMSDNDFVTQNGHLNFGKFNYSDASGFNLDSQILAFQVTLPI